MVSADVWKGDIAPYPPSPELTAAGGLQDAVLGREGQYSLLSGIDPYGDTVFNGVQMPRVVAELERLLEVPNLPAYRRRSITCVLSLAQACLGKAHWYLVFAGD